MTIIDIKNGCVQLKAQSSHLKMCYIGVQIKASLSNKGSTSLFFSPKTYLAQDLSIWLKLWKDVLGQPIWTFLYAGWIVILTSEASQILFVGHAPTLAPFMGNKHKSPQNTMTNIPLATQSTNANERFQAWKARREMKQEEYSDTCKFCSNKPNS